jgi:hypothetical protein
MSKYLRLFVNGLLWGGGRLRCVGFLGSSWSMVDVLLCVVAAPPLIIRGHTLNLYYPLFWGGELPTAPSLI